MAFNDPIAELLTRIRNASSAKHRFVDMYSARMRLSVLQILKDKGFISDFQTDEEKIKVRIFLKYNKKREPIIHNLKRVSSPGLRIYRGYTKLPRVLGGIGIAIISTSKGVMDDETARNMKLGGEVLCTIW